MEILVATAVAVLIMGAISSVFYYLLVIPPQQTDQLNAENQLRLSLDWIQRDGVQAHSFTPNPTPCPDDCEGSCNYGYFSSYADPSCADPDDPDCCKILVAYSYDDDNERLIREGSIVREGSIDCEDPPKTTTIAYNIARCGDVTFDCGGDDTCNGRNPITVNMTVTRNENSQNKVRKEITITDTRKIEMRAEQ
jgi:hypothetical protein